MNKNDTRSNSPEGLDFDPYIKKYYEKLDDRLGLSKEVPKRLSNSFKAKLLSTAHPVKKNFLSTKSFITSLIAAFSAGLMISQFALAPTLVATRGIDDRSTFVTPTGSNTISVYPNSPNQYSQELITSSINAHLRITVEKIADITEIHIDGFVSNKQDQANVKAALGIPLASEGSRTILIHASKP